jgi:hypothetical protein
MSEGARSEQGEEGLGAPSDVVDGVGFFVLNFGAVQKMNVTMLESACRRRIKTRSPPRRCHPELTVPSVGVKSLRKLVKLGRGQLPRSRRAFLLLDLAVVFLLLRSTRLLQVGGFLLLGRLLLLGGLVADF